MKIKFIEESNQDNILMETEKGELISALFAPYTQISLTVHDKIFICTHEYNIAKIKENELDIFVRIIDIYSENERKFI
ncbi:hypothetical protein [Clostridium tyrobutyricum]|uniref:hypothetical protein n=1 Tax=Clostridium tyrobutyricum TaxID=1519 RepID=UPI0030CF6BD7